MSKWPRVLAGVLDDDVAHEAGRRLARQRQAQEQAQQVGAGAGVAQQARARRSAPRLRRSTRASRTIEIAISSGSETSRSQPLADRRRQSPIELADIAPVALTPWRSASPADRRELVDDRTSDRGGRTRRRRRPASSRPRPSPSPRPTTASASRRPKLPSESHANSAGGGPCSATASSINRRTSASTTTESTPLIRLAARPAACIAISVARSCADGRPEAGDVGRVGDRPPQHDRRVGLVCEQVDVGGDADQFAAARDAPGRGGCPGRSSAASARRRSAPGRTVTTGVVITSPTGVSTGRPAATTRERRSRSVTIPSSPSPRVDQDRADPLLLHPRGGVAQGHPRLADHRAAFAPSTRTASWPTSRSLARAVGSPPGRGRSISARATDRSPAGSAKQRDHVLRGEPVAERSLPGPRLPARRQPREHPRMAEGLARAEQVEHPAVVAQLDRAGAEHPHRVGRALALAEDRRRRPRSTRSRPAPPGARAPPARASGTVRAPSGTRRCRACAAHAAYARGAAQISPARMCSVPRMWVRISAAAARRRRRAGWRPARRAGRWSGSAPPRGGR